MEFKMKITNDVNNKSDFLSIANKGEEDTSLLGSLFSMNLNSNELKSKDIQLIKFQICLKKILN